jgi:2-methylisocitrate lyase-like PEP mutase family enzyme
MSNNFNKFKTLHHSDNLFVLPNVWNAKSALLFEELNFPAIATSSMAVANSLGYEDGETMPFSDYLFIIKRILSSIQIPLSVDMEMGYGTTDEKIFTNIQQLTDLGVVGINIEDSAIAKSARTLKDANAFAKTIEQIKNKLAAKGINLFINIRCDTYILNVKNKQQETLSRLKLYEKTGANGIFLPCICEEKDIAEIISHTKLPLNVMCIPGLPDFNTLNKVGVKRVSMGPFLFNKIYSNITEFSNTILKDKSFAAILS